MANKNVEIRGGGIAEYLTNARGMDPPLRGVLVPCINLITGKPDPIVTFQGHPKRGGAGLLCVSTIKQYGGEIVELD